MKATEFWTEMWGKLIYFMYELRGIGGEHLYCPACDEWVHEGEVETSNDHVWDGVEHEAPTNTGVETHVFQVRDTINYLEKRGTDLLDLYHSE
jgi:hypothetical protein